MAKRIDYIEPVNKVFTNKKGQKVRAVEHVLVDNKHYYKPIIELDELISHKSLINGTFRITTTPKKQKGVYEAPVSYGRFKNLKDKVILAVDGATYTTGIALYRPNIPIYTEEKTVFGDTSSERIGKMTNYIETLIDCYGVEIVFYEEPKNKNHNYALGGLITFVRDIVKKKGVEFRNIIPSSWQSQCGIHTDRANGKELSVKIASKKMNKPMGEDEADAFNMLDYCLKELEEKEKTEVA